MLEKVISLVFCAAILAAPTAGTRPARKITAEQAMKRKAKKIAFTDSLRGAIARYSTLAGVKIEVDWAGLAGTGVKGSAKVAMNLSDVSAAELLDLTLVQAQTKGNELAWYVDKSIVRVTTRQRLMYGDLSVPEPPLGSKKTKRPARRTRPPVKEWAFDNTELSDIVDIVRDTTGINVHVNWRALEQLDIRKDTTVSLKASNITVGRAMDLITDQLSANRSKLERVYWLVDDGVLTITTGSALNRETFTRTFYVADLLMVIPDFKGRRAGTSRDRDSDFDDDRIRTRRRRVSRTDDLDSDSDSLASIAEKEAELREKLTQIVKTSIGEEMWQPQGKGSIQFLNKRMIISQTKLGFLLLGKTVGKR